MASASSFCLLIILATTILPSFAKAATCNEELVTFIWTCLDYVSLYPSTDPLPDSPSDVCCSHFANMLASGNGPCLCAYLRKPPGRYPFNHTRVHSLPSVCPLPPELTSQIVSHNFSLHSFCSDPVAPAPQPEHHHQSDVTELSPGPAPVPAPRSRRALHPPPPPPSPPAFHRQDLRPVTPQPPPSFDSNSGATQVSSATTKSGNTLSWLLILTFAVLILGLTA